MSYQPLRAPTPNRIRPTAGLPHIASTGETPHQRRNQPYAEILQEVPVAQTGARVMLGFLLTLAFTPHFAALTGFHLGVYLTSIVICTSATALLIGPAAFHRIVFHQDLKHALATCSNRFAFFGLILLMLALSCELLVILDVVLGAPRSIWLTVGITQWFTIWWYAVPLWNRARHRRTDNSPTETSRLVAFPSLSRAPVKYGHR